MEEFPANISRKKQDWPETKSEQLAAESFENKTLQNEIVQESSKRQALVLTERQIEYCLMRNLKFKINLRTYNESNGKGNANQSKPFASLFFSGNIRNDCSAQADVALAQTAQCSK